MKVYQYALPRSGSTQILQILRLLLGEENVNYSHDFREIDGPLICTYRDFRDVTISHWRIWHGQLDKTAKLINVPTKQQLISLIGTTMKIRISQLNLHKVRYKDKEDILWLKYADFYNNYDYIFSELEKFLKIEISEEKRKEIIEKTNIKTNIEIANNVEIKNKKRIFDNYDKNSHIHANHISPIEPKPGYWKEVVPKDLWNMVEVGLKNDLEEWGFK